MCISIYLYHDKVLIPYESRTEAGFYVESEPVDVSLISATDFVVRTIQIHLASKPPEIPTPAPNVLNQKRSAVARLAGARSWKMFFASAKLFKICSNDHSIQIFLMQKMRDFWTKPPAPLAIISSPTDIESVWRAITSAINSKEGTSHATESFPNS